MMERMGFREYCGARLGLVQQLCRFVDKNVALGIAESVQGRSPPLKTRDDAIQVTFGRIALWLQTIDRLDRPQDAQAIGAGARCIFELYLDLRWFQQSSDPTLPRRFFTHPELQMYHVAKKVLKHIDDNPASTLPREVYAGWIKWYDKDPPTPADRVREHWGERNGKPAWPGDHWSGAGDLRKRAAEIGIDCLDMYVERYWFLSSLTHAGASPVLGRSIADRDWTNQQCAVGYRCAFRDAYASTCLTCDLLGAREHVQDFEPRMRELKRTSDDIDRLAPTPKAAPDHPA